jgi:glycosyltransferase involved in cell wall biosynthesis
MAFSHSNNGMLNRSICLNMIVRDEAAVIERCLASVRPFIDHWVIVDTGSVDDTPQRIHAALAGIPGELHHRPWRNFGHNRTEALNLARAHADYLLFIDADETLESKTGASFTRLDGPAFSLEARFGELSYDRVSLVSTALPWRWEGVLHEYLDAGRPVEQPRVPGCWIQVRPDGARSRDPQKFEKDAAVLASAFLDDPHNGRYAFYLAQSYRDAGLLELARRYYEQRAAMSGWAEETWYAQYEVARLSERLLDTHERIVSAYLRAYQTRPQRAESLVALAAYCRGRGEWHNAYLFARTAVETPLSADRLFIDVAAHQWRGKDEMALAAFYTGRRAEASFLWQSILACPALPAIDRARIEGNQGFL